MPLGNSQQEYQPYAHELISLENAAAVCGLTPDHLRRLARKGELWALKPGREWLTTEVAVKAYKARNIRPGRKPDLGRL